MTRSLIVGVDATGDPGEGCARAPRWPSLTWARHAQVRVR